MDMDVEQLAFKANEAATSAYVPYSKTRNGAVLVATDGRQFSGAKIEFCNYASSICAPKVALAKAVSAGARDFALLVVAGDGIDRSYLCGDCRQCFSEFSPSMKVVTDADVGTSITLSSLLPYGFKLK